jgi:hypothetical protein
MMAAATERVPVLMTPAEKKRLVAKAVKAGMKMSEFMREAAAAYQPGEEDEALGAMIEQMNIATDSTGEAIDRAIEFVSESNKRIEQMEAAKGAK